MAKTKPHEKNKPDRSPSARGRAAKRKGAAFERRVANILRDVFPEARRGIGQARNANEVPDVDGTPYWIEAKNRNRVDVEAAFVQAEQAAEEAAIGLGKQKRPPIVIWKETNRKAIYVSCKLWVLFETLLGAQTDLTCTLRDIIAGAGTKLVGDPFIPLIMITLRLEDWLALVKEGKNNVSV